MTTLAGAFVAGGCAMLEVVGMKDKPATNAEVKISRIQSNA